MSQLKETLNRSHQQIKFAIWCETCQDWVTDFRISGYNLWVLCDGCGEGLIKVIK
jgi:hypothetical protein